MALSDTAIRKAKPLDKGYKLYDELSLYLIISPSGSRLCRMKYKRHGIEKKLSPSSTWPSQVQRQTHPHCPW